MQNFDKKEKKNLIIDPVEGYFECISSCDINDGMCTSKCVEMLRDYET